MVIYILEKYGLSKKSIMNYFSKLYESDAQISIQRAKLFGEIINSFNAEQKKYLNNINTIDKIIHEYAQEN